MISVHQGEKNGRNRSAASGTLFSDRESLGKFSKSFQFLTIFVEFDPLESTPAWNGMLAPLYFLLSNRFCLCPVEHPEIIDYGLHAFLIGRYCLPKLISVSNRKSVKRGSCYQSLSEIGLPLKQTLLVQFQTCLLGIQYSCTYQNTWNVGDISFFVL